MCTQQASIYSIWSKIHTGCDELLAISNSDVRYYRYIDYHDIIVNIVIMI